MDIKEYLSELDANTLSAVELIHTYSTDKIVFKNEGECSIAEILEHICISDNRTLELLKSDSDKVSPTIELYGHEKLKMMVVDDKGGAKMTETEIKELKGIVTDFTSFEKVFLKQRDKLYNSLKNGEIIISNKTYDHLYFNEMTVTDWLRYTIYHTTRHLNDIKDSSMAYKKWTVEA